jgi:hypothetical protein
VKGAVIRKSLFSLLTAAIVFLGTALSCSASTVAVELTGVNGVSTDGIYMDPYYGTINRSSGILVCDDFSHDTNIGESWQATVSTFSDLSSVRFQQGTPAATLEAYDEAAYLYDSLLDNPSQYSGISFALWALFTPGATGYSGFTADSQSWLTSAQNQTYYAGEFANFEVLTPTNAGQDSPQEFLTATPEPANVLLLLSGLCFLTLLLRKKIFV